MGKVEDSWGETRAAAEGGLVLGDSWMIGSWFWGDWRAGRNTLTSIFCTTEFGRPPSSMRIMFVRDTYVDQMSYLLTCLAPIKVLGGLMEAWNVPQELLFLSYQLCLLVTSARWLGYQRILNKLFRVNSRRNSSRVTLLDWKVYRGISPFTWSFSNVNPSSL